MIDPIADIRALLAPNLTEAEGALARREEQYPALVAAGNMDQATAAHEIDVWRAIVADWRRIVRNEPTWANKVPIADKLAVLVEAARRFEAAIAKSIANLPDNVRRDCAEITYRGYLRDVHGKHLGPYLDLLARRDRIEDMHAIYISELPGTRPWRGIWRGIDHYLTFHTDCRAKPPQKAAA